VIQKLLKNITFFAISLQRFVFSQGHAVLCITNINFMYSRCWTVAAQDWCAALCRAP